MSICLFRTLWVYTQAILQSCHCMTRRQVMKMVSFCKHCSFNWCKRVNVSWWYRTLITSTNRQEDICWNYSFMSKDWFCPAKPVVFIVMYFSWVCVLIIFRGVVKIERLETVPRIWKFLIQKVVSTIQLLFNWYYIYWFKLVVSRLFCAEPTTPAHCVKNVHYIEFLWAREGGGQM
jgi:hypothetical protein